MPKVAQPGCSRWGPAASDFRGHKLKGFNGLMLQAGKLTSCLWNESSGWPYLSSFEKEARHQDLVKYLSFHGVNGLKAFNILITLPPLSYLLTLPWRKAF